MKKKHIVKAFISLVFLAPGACIDNQYYDAYGDKCTDHLAVFVEWQNCQKGERTVNLNANVNQPQHDPNVKK